MVKKKSVLILFFSLVLVALIILVSAAVSWNTPIETFYGDEDIFYEYNVSKNVSGVEGELIIDIDTIADKRITWNNGTHIFNYTSLDNLPWLSYNQSNFILTINATHDNQTGEFKIPFQARDDVEEGTVRTLIFIINATNDEPEFVEIEDFYIYFTNGTLRNYDFSVIDEEEHYPLNFSIEFFPNCTYADWLGKTNGVDCDLFNLVNTSENNAEFNYTPSEDDVGVYWAQISVTEAEHSCPHVYCHNETYEQRHTIRHNVTIRVLSKLTIDATDCENHNFTEGVLENCTIEVRTTYENSDFNINSLASFSNYEATPSNTTWFFPELQMQTTDYVKRFNVSVNASRYLVGNWDINLSSLDTITSETADTFFSIFVNWTGNSEPEILGINSQYNVSTNLDTTVNFNVTDKDFLIEDKYFYNESVTINIKTINISSGDEVTGFYTIEKKAVSGQTMPVDIIFSPNESQSGNFIINISAIDNSSALTYDTFNLTVFQNSFPYWNKTEYEFNFTVNATIGTTISNLTNLNLTDDSYASDEDEGDILSFTLSGNYPPSFDLTSEGILNFFPWKQDVGYWEFNITATDLLGLSNSSLWKINVSNINSPPKIEDFFINSNSSLNAVVNQDQIVEIQFIGYDDDLNISYAPYNEILNVSINITNTSFVSELISFSFEEDIAGENNILFISSFTPRFQNRGNYSVEINLSDKSGAYDILVFNLTILGVNSAPEIHNLTDIETSILNESFSFQINATDEEDDYEGIPLNYFINSTNLSAPDLNINSTTGLISFNFSRNESYAGVWEYNVSVVDNASAVTTEFFNLTVYGTPNISFPEQNFLFNFSENSTNLINLSVDYMVEGANLSYFVYTDNIVYYWINESTENKSFYYTNLSLVDSFFDNWNSEENITINLTLDFLSETYGLLKNLTIIVLKTDYPLLNSSINYKLNVSHVNYPLETIANIPSPLTGYVGTPIKIDLTNYFYDADAFDIYYHQQINFSLNQSDDTGVIVSTFSSFDEWNLSLNSNHVGTFNLSIIASEINISNSSEIIKKVSSNWFSFIFQDPPTIPTPSPGGGTRIEERVDHYALKIISPKDINLERGDYIELEFSVFNQGNVDLEGIDLSSILTIGGELNKDIEITFSEDYIDILKIGESRDYSLEIYVGSHAVGDYRVTIYGNVSRPKFIDWGTFHISVKSLNESELAGMLIFTEKLIIENPECFELRELYYEGKTHFDKGNYAEAERIAREVVFACENAILLSEQISFFDDRVGISLFSSLVISVIVFLGGLVYYFYKRIKFKKFIDNEML